MSEKKLIIQAALCGNGTMKKVAPSVPYTPEEISDQAVACALAGASVVHIHVREDKEVNGRLIVGYQSMSLDKFTETVELCREKCAAAGTDLILNLTTSGGEPDDEKRLRHLEAIRPEMCSFSVNSLNWSYRSVFENSPRFLEKLAREVVRLGIKPEFEVFDTGHIDAVLHYIKEYGIPGNPHFEFIMGVGGSMPAATLNLAFMASKLPAGATWSVSGISKAHMPMLLAGLSMNCDGLRVGLEDNILYGRGADGAKIPATNVMLVQRAVRIAREAGREIADAQEARALLGITRNCLKDEG